MNDCRSDSHRKKLITAEIRKSFIDFFKGAAHAEVPSASLLCLNDPTLLFVNSGMVQFKDVFAGTDKRSYSRAVTAQKCLRVSGKHNDLDEVGRSRRHHTFFEMLGNFSFGDYFKSEAISYAWKFVTETLGLEKEKLWVTVHHSDEEALNLWVKNTPVASERIIKLGDKTNLWSAGEVGPWGYCSEIFYYMGSDGDAQSVNDFMKDDGRYLEIWNLVFMQFYKDEAGNSTPLPNPCIDTGMGLERVASILAGKKANFDADVFETIFAKISELSGKEYVGEVYPNDDGAVVDEQVEIDTAMRVIADHSRAAAFLIADGVTPGNEGASYVLRRLLRRAIRYGLSLELKNDFMADVSSSVVAAMEQAYPELFRAKNQIKELISIEESQFRKTLDSGVGLLKQWLASAGGEKVLPGEVAFRLYDTFGFPLDLTEDFLREKGGSVDIAGFNERMELQRLRSNKNLGGGSSIKLGTVGGSSKERTFKELFGQLPELNSFVGYSTKECESTLESVLKRGDDIGLVFDKTCFYTEMGGQVGDSGKIILGDTILTISHTEMLPTGQIVHLVKRDESAANEDFIPNLKSLEEVVNTKILLSIDRERRAAISAHHSATHFLHSALRKILGEHVQQRGSLVEHDRLRFDFSHYKALTQDELIAIGYLVNSEIRKNYECHTVETSLEEAKRKGALSFFGDKYSDVVRMVEFGDFSIELCGGTHVTFSGKIGLFLLLSEGSIASGVRRVECCVGDSALKYLKGWQKTLNTTSQLLKVSHDKLEGRIESLLEESREQKLKLKKLENSLSNYIASELLENMEKTASGVPLVATSVRDYSKDQIVSITDSVLRNQQDALVLIHDSLNSSLFIRIKQGKGAAEIANELKDKFNLKGGGNRDSATLVGVNESVFAAGLNYLQDKC
jgi:alanyl-tRNA synthetase